MVKQKATVYECDNPECDTLKYEVHHGEPPVGFHFEGGIHVHPRGGRWIPDVYACTEACIVPAVKYSIEAV